MANDPATVFVIRRARAEEVRAIRRLVVESMGHWGRAPDFLEQAAQLMSLSAEDLTRDEAFVLMLGEEVVGFCRVSLAAPMAEIEELHVRPGWIGRGFGRALFDHAVQRAQDLGAEVLRWATDGYALGFYERVGGRVIGTCPSGIEGDEPFTVMELALGGSQDPTSGA